MSRRALSFWALALAGAGLDLATKALVFAKFSVGSSTVLIPRLLSIQLTTNAGIAWGLFPSRIWGLVSVAAVPLIAWSFLKRKEARAAELHCGALILAGALGNGWDRLVRASVRDFILVPWIPNFNLADAMLSCSVAVLCFHWILHDRRPVGDPGPAHPRQPDDGGVGDLGRDHGPRP